jgi:tetratricopeptide (TPR) repeat protein
MRQGESQSGLPEPGPRRRSVWVLSVAAAGLVLLVFALLKVRPYFALQKQIPRLPDLTEKSTILASEIRARDKAARAFPVRGDKVGELGKVYQANAFAKEAESCYLAAARLSPKNSLWPYYLSYLRQQRGDAEGAEGLLRQVIIKAPDYAPARLKLADLGFKSGKTEEAKAAYLELQDDQAMGPYAGLGLARIAIGQNRWEEARSSLEKALRLDPQFKPAYRMLAVVQDHFGRTEESEILRERAGIERFSEAPDPWVEELAALCYDPKELMRLANIAFQTNKYERAFGLYKKALDIDPDNLENLLEIALMVFDSGNREAARPLFLKALALRSGDETALYHLATIDFLAGRLADARLTFEKLVEVHPQNVDGWTGLGDVAFKNRDFRTAEAHYKKAQAINPRISKVQYAMGKIEMVRGNWQVALEYLEKASELDARSADTWFSIGAILARQGRLDEAIANYRKALGENPEFGTAHYNIANALFRQGKMAEARWRYQRAIECDPEIAEAYLNLATLLEREGRHGEALEFFNKALSLARSQGNTELEQTINTQIERRK